MDTAQFLARVIPPGNFIAISINSKPTEKGGFSVRMFPHGQFAEAAGYAKWAVGKGFDAYHSNASFNLAQTNGQDSRGNPKFKGSKTGENVMAIKAFWIDFDVIRPGDGKKADQAYPDRMSAMAWMQQFIQAIQLPRPSIIVNSGYGFHVYWVLEDPMPAPAWLPYGDALRSALIAHGFKGDPGISGDVARILRPPGTLNCKATPHVAVEALDKLTRGDIPNAIMLATLQPFVGAARVPAKVGVATTGVAGPSNSVAALAGGAGATVTAIFGAAAPANMNAAAQAGTPTLPKRPRFMSNMLGKCGQIDTSLLEGGRNDDRNTWYLGHLTLAHFCDDGAQFVHQLGYAHAGYSQASTDAAVQQVKNELATNNRGAPSCAHYARVKPAICQACPFYGKIKSPYELGLPLSDLPEGFRNHNGELQASVFNAKGNDYIWVGLLPGSVTNPLLDVRQTGGHDLTFDYTLRGKTFTVFVVEPDLPTDIGALNKLFSTQFLGIPQGNETRFRGFILAWINELRARQQVRDGQVRAFGWAKHQGKRVGFSVGGTLYRADGTTAPAPGGDKEILSIYQPSGDIGMWKAAAAFVSAGRPDQQVVIAASLGAPLVELTGHSGIIMSEWSRQSAIGKTSGLMVGQAVWGKGNILLKLNDTQNYVMRRLAETRAMPAFWDECLTKPEEEADFVRGMFQITQGQEKGRLSADASARGVSDWKTLMVFAANKPMMDMVIAHHPGDAGAVRCFEWEMAIPQALSDPKAQATIASVEDNYGSAGRLYAAWIASNVAWVQQHLDAELALNAANLQAQQAERFFNAAISVVMTGAAIGKHLGLVDFDLPAMRDFLYRTFIQLRTNRERDVVVSAKGYDLDQILASYMSEHTPRKLVTDIFGRRGPTKVQVRMPPTDHRVSVQIAVDDKMMRIDRAEFNTWARKRKLAASDLIESMVATWGASVAKGVIGGGTHWSTGTALWAVDIPLNHPDLAAFLQVPDATGQSGTPPPSALSGQPPPTLMGRATSHGSKGSSPHIP